MKSIYGDIPEKTVCDNISDLINQVFKLLPYKEQKNEKLDFLFASLLFRLVGMSKLFVDEPRWITIISYLESARHEENFTLYRKAILDTCSILSSIRKEDSHA